MFWFAALSVLVMAGMMWGRHGFWLADQVLRNSDNELEDWPSVCAIVPARDEAETIQACLTALADQDYAGTLSIILVNDGSSDGTGTLARGLDCRRSITVLDAPPKPDGWSGKLAALDHGIGFAEKADYLWFTDADIVHSPGTLRALTLKAVQAQRTMVSAMVHLACDSFWERLLVPAFIFFFQKLYPFRAVNHPPYRCSAAAGGCILIERQFLANAGGLHPIKDALIDDCSLARLVRDSGGSLWLGLSTLSRSLRRYNRLAEFWTMVRRTAFTQLRYRWGLLVVTGGFMATAYLAGPAAVFWGFWHGEIKTIIVGFSAFAMGQALYLPTLNHYGLRLVWGLGLPLAALLYTLMTAHSALDHVRGRTGRWKGRTYPATVR